jgi:hypothetical protein
MIGVARKAKIQLLPADPKNQDSYSFRHNRLRLQF